MIIDFLKKTVKFIKNMITQDNIAAAQIAQIFGSELLKVQQSVSDSTSQPEIVKLNPKQFLLGQTNVGNFRREDERQFLQNLNREAEMMHPLPETSSPPPFQPPVQPPVQPSAVAQQPGQPNFALASTAQQNADALTMIAIFLERIANKIESVDLKPKRKTIKRKTKNKKLTLLNENNV